MSGRCEWQGRVHLNPKLDASRNEILHSHQKCLPRKSCV